MKKYALTTYFFKFLDIGIVVGSVSHMQIAFGDNRGNRMFTPHAMWKMFIEIHADIKRLMQSTVPSSIQDLNVELIKIYDKVNIKWHVCT